MKQAKVKATVKHDSGKSTLTVWATSFEEATQKVMQAEQCPEHAIVKMQVVKPTLSDIKQNTLDTSPYFFSRDTLRFFGQRMSDFRVARLNKHEFEISAPIKGSHTAMTRRVYDAFKGTLN